ncbi:Retrovirus-related Pol polyprotein from type-1 retrotransposable element R1 [Eumeta japonica]|uniref:Retrovirus-related Pol polyprotein from type-1 retrotransposable element R1 n=1 Tax=Eumeta variegata TaxID=151549 RepID=A0A4C1XPM5_EUMVA|nr:Retrovirus-related Pol polyprotein from type-1 retrotransposable element R1 [Eumeta japonica]
MTSQVAQALTGHGGFAQYLFRFKLRDSPHCACDPAKIQEVLHVLRDCDMFLQECAALEAEIGVRILGRHLPEILNDARIKGAFDNAWWPAIRNQLLAHKCPVNLRGMMMGYLRDREVVVRYAGEEFRKGTSKGCIQGSIAGPTFWNLVLDSLLRELEDLGVYVQAFVDDVVLMSGQSA